MVEWNTAVVLAMARGFEGGLDWIDRLERRGELGGYRLLPAAKADLLRRAGRFGEAAAAYRRALGPVRNPAERAYLDRRLREVNGPDETVESGLPTRKEDSGWQAGGPN